LSPPLCSLPCTVSGALNSISTLFTLDLYKRWRPGASDRKLTAIGRTATFVAMIAAILWSPLISHFQSIFQGIVTLICYIAPPITAVFVWGVFWRRASSAAAMTTLATGSALGLAVFLLDWFKASTGWNVPSMMATFYLFLVCSAILAAVSLRHPHKHTAESEALVWKNPASAITGPWRGIFDYRAVAAVLLAIMIALYAIFA
jgi:SSS family solute:Na+ symporter